MAVERARVIAPEGMTLPELPASMNWLNPVIGNDTDRGQWLLLRANPGGSDVFARIERVRHDEGHVLATRHLNSESPIALPIAQAFELAAEVAYNSPQ